MSIDAKSETIVQASGLLFDMDGVLVSSLASVRRSWRAWAHEFGVPNADTLEIPHGMRAVEIIAMLAPEADAAQGLSRINAIEVADVADTVVLPGARALTQSLPAGRWTIVTSATRELLAARLAAAQLPMPQQTVSADDVERGKPDPQPYLLGAQRLGFHASQCIVVEDAPEGTRAGKAAGARVLGVAGTVPAQELFLAGADWVVASLEAVTLVSMTGDGSLQLSLGASALSAVDLIGA